jgi:4-amino-4-deoxy-L-arabinose transferase-like glycosyltransferase
LGRRRRLAPSDDQPPPPRLSAFAETSIVSAQTHGGGGIGPAEGRARRIGLPKVSVRHAFRLHHVIVLTVLLIGAGVRLWGIDFGLPYLYHPDEPIKVARAQAILKTGDINPHYFLKPPFYIYLNALAYVPYLALEQLEGKPATIQSLQPPAMLVTGTGITSQPSTVVLGRLVSLLFGSMSIVMVYLLAAKVFASRFSAVISSMFVALSPGLVPHSRFITPDALVVFFCLLTVYACLQVYRRGNAMDYALAGAAGALAASAKYSAVIVLVVPLMAHFLANGFRAGFTNKKIFISAIAAVDAFVLLNPVVLLSFPEFYKAAISEAVHYATGHLGAEGDSLVWYLHYFWTTEGLIAILGVVGMILGGLRPSRESNLLATFPVVFFIFISSFAVRNDRTAIPITPFLYMFGVQFLVALWQSRWGDSRWRQVRRVVVAGIIAFMLVRSGVAVYQDTIRLVTVDSRETSRVWIGREIAAGSRFAIESYSPYIDPGRYQLIGVEKLIDHDLGWYRAQQVDYVVASTGMYGRFLDEPAKYRPQLMAYSNIFSSWKLVRLFDDGGYEVRIYRVP